jgi:hypothetical protein
VSIIPELIERNPIADVRFGSRTALPDSGRECPVFLEADVEALNLAHVVLPFALKQEARTAISGVIGSTF